MLKSAFSGLQITKLSLTIRVYLHSFSCCCLPNLWNSQKIRTYCSSRSSQDIDFGVNQKHILFSNCS